MVIYIIFYSNHFNEIELVNILGISECMIINNDIKYLLHWIEGMQVKNNAIILKWKILEVKKFNN